MEGKGDSSYSRNPQDWDSVDAGSVKRKSRIEEDEEIQRLLEGFAEDESSPDGQGPGMRSTAVHGPATLKHGLTKGMEQLKQQRASCFDESQGRLLDKMLASYVEAISILDETIWNEEADPGIMSFEPDSLDPFTIANPFQDLSASAMQLRRPLYSRRRSSESWTVERVGFGGVWDDGYSWRKYGQKDVLGSKFPRSYYRCTHKFDLGCPATKQLQWSDEYPEKCETVYRGRHTCNQTPLTAKPPSPSEEAESNHP